MKTITGRPPHPAIERTAAEWLAALAKLDARLQATVARLIWWDYSESTPGLHEALAWSLDVPFQEEITDTEIRRGLRRLGYSAEETYSRVRFKTREIALHLQHRVRNGSRRPTDCETTKTRAVAWTVWGGCA